MSTGTDFVQAVAERDHDRLAALLADRVDFKGLTPRRFWEGGTPAEVLDVVLGHWFEESDHVDRVVLTEEGAVEDVQRVGYRFAITNPDGPHLVEQQAYFHATDGRIDYLRVVCSGFRPSASRA
jgi:hypothetical protein